MKTIIKNGRVVSPAADLDTLTDILVTDGKITEIRPGIACAGAEELDACGGLVLPGLIDMHCNISGPGCEYMEEIDHISKCAAKGGFTGITCLPDTRPAIDNRALVDYIICKSRENGGVSFYPYGSMTVGCLGAEIAEIGGMARAGIVGISDGDYPIADAHLMRNIFLYSLMFGLPVITHCEDKTLSAGGVVNEGAVSVCLGLKGIPREAEEVMVSRNLILAGATGAKLHIVHVSTKGSVELIRNAKKRGVNVTAETCPHYFMLTEDAVGDYNTFAKVDPPLRTEEDVAALLEGIADGTVDVISSGHSPVSLEYKKIEFDKAAWGISSLEAALPLSYTKLVGEGVLSLRELSEKMSGCPARILGLKGKGSIEPGFDADFTILETGINEKIDAGAFLSKSKFSPFDGREVRARVRNTIAGGRVIY